MVGAPPRITVKVAVVVQAILVQQGIRSAARDGRPILKGCVFEGWMAGCWRPLRRSTSHKLSWAAAMLMTDAIKLWAQQHAI